MTDLLLTSSAAAAGGYLTLTGIVALIASAHPDEKRRADAARILDKVLRLIRPFGLRDLGNDPVPRQNYSHLL